VRGLREIIFNYIACMLAGVMRPHYGGAWVPAHAGNSEMTIYNFGKGILSLAVQFFKKALTIIRVIKLIGRNIS